MKLSDFAASAQVEDRDTLLHAAAAFNKTRTEYPRDATVHRLFVRQAAKRPEAIAVVDSVRIITYGDLDEQSNKLARLLVDYGLTAEGSVAVMIDRCVDMVTALLGTLKAGGAYLPINHDVPYDRVRFMLQEARCRFLISGKLHIRAINRLQWDCPDLACIVCLDSNNIHSEPEATGEMMKEEVWDYLRRDMFDDISGGGWRSSYTGEWLSREVMDQYGDNIRDKLLPYLTPRSRVLEIGCASGISMFRLAPHVGFYLGTDISGAVLEWSEHERQNRGLNNIVLRRLAAHETDQIGETGFDVVIINSVIQCFSGLNYFRDVIRKSLARMADRGILFFGNVWDQDLKDDFAGSLVTFANEHATENCRTKTDRSEELFVSRAFFEDLRHELPEIVSVEYSASLATAASELSEYGYDALIRIDKSQTKSLGALVPRNKHQLDRRILEQYSGDGLVDCADAGNLAYVMYTSGTTGFPKAVMIDHRAIVRLVINTTYIRLTENDRILATGSLAFDASTFEIWGALLNGGRLSLPSSDAILDARAMGDLIAQQGITTVFLTTSLFNLLVDTDHTIFREVRTLFSGGEKVSPSHFNILRRSFPGMTLCHVYGPTESTTYATCFPVERTYERDIPIGKPISNTTAWILDRDLRPVSVGVAGELYLGGDGLARGYLNDPALTAERFVPSPFEPGERLYKTGDLCRWLAEGDIEFLGRRDHQVKVRGYRIELDEIEGHLLRHEAVTQAAVIVALTGTDESKELVAYVSGRGLLQAEALRDHLKKTLPEYMIPSYFVTLNKLPLKASGKVDRNNLPDPQIERSEPVRAMQPLSTVTERELARIWEEVLNRRVSSATDNFFHLGGHSLKVTKLVSLIAKRLGVSVPLSVVFRLPRLGDMAAYILDTARFGVKEIDDDMVLLTGAPVQQKTLFAFPPGTGDALGFNMVAELLKPCNFYAFNFIESGRRLTQYAECVISAEPTGPYTLFGYSSGGNLAYHVARELEERGRRVSDIIMVDSARKFARIPAKEGEIDSVAEAFVNDDSVRPYLTDGILREKALRRVKSSLSYFEDAVDHHMIDADVHVILSEDSDDIYRDESGAVLVSVSGWAEVTRGRLRKYQGAGDHNHMLHEPHLLQNSKLIRHIVDAAAQDSCGGGAASS